VLRSVTRTLFCAVLFAAPSVFAQGASPASPAQVPSAPAPATAETVSDQVAAAEAAIAKSDWKTAETNLDPWLAAHPTDPRALFDAGYVADAQNHLDDAAGFYRRAATADPKSFEAHISLGLLLARQGKLDEARPELAAATQLNPGEATPAAKARAWRALAQIDRATDPTQASSDLLEALKLSAETTDDTLMAASLAEQAGQPEAAEAAYRRVLVKDPNSKVALAGLGHVLLQRKQYPQAETQLRAALAQSPGDPALTAELATALAAQNKGEALPLLQQLHQAHPEDSAITRLLAAVEADAGNFADSDKLYSDLLAAHPDDPDLLVAHGQDLVRQLKFADAFDAFDKASQADSTNADAWSGLAFTASRTGKPGVTLHALTMRSKYLPENASTYFLWATAYDTLHQKAEAVAYYHHFLDASAGKFPDQEWQARQRLQLLEKK